MNLKRLFALCGIALVVVGLAVPVAAQQEEKGKFRNPYFIYEDANQARGPRTINFDNPAPEINAATSTDWVLHNLDLGNTRYSTLNQINTNNVKTLVPRWLAQTGVIIGASFQTTPIVVNGLMYITDPQGSVYALNGLTGQKVWKYDVSNLIPGGELGIANRGVVYGDGVLYVAAGPSIFAMDAKTGVGLESFGPKGQSDVLTAAVKDKFPGKRPISLGYAFTAAPQYNKGIVYVGATLSERHIPGGLVMAIDAKTSKLLWKFNTVPQGPEDDGWAIAGPTWVGGARNGGGIWETPAIDPALGMIYVSVANPSPDLDGSARKGINLFTNSMVALDLNTGKLKWYFQQLHHDIWDLDSVSPPMLFDVKSGGRTIKAVAEAQKDGYLFILNRENGVPVNGVVEVAVPTASDVPGEQPWPTQPVPYTAFGRPMEPFVPIFPVKISSDLASRSVAWLTPMSSKQIYITAPGTQGGANFAPLSFNPQTGLVYVTGVDQPASYTVQIVGATLKPGDSSLLRTAGPIGRPLLGEGTLTAYDPSTGAMVWQAPLPGLAQAGSVVTAGGLIFVGEASGYFHAFDARTGAELWKFYTGAGIVATPIVYEINGEQFVTVASGAGAIVSRNADKGDLVVTFALPKQ